MCRVRETEQSALVHIGSLQPCQMWPLETHMALKMTSQQL